VAEILFPVFSALQQKPRSEGPICLFRSFFGSSRSRRCATVGALNSRRLPAASVSDRRRKLAAEAHRVLVVLHRSQEFWYHYDAFSFYFLRVARSRSTPLISFVTAVFTVCDQRGGFCPIWMQRRAGVPASAMVAQIFTTTILLRRGCSHAGLWAQGRPFRLACPLGSGIVPALVLAPDFHHAGFFSSQAPHWWTGGGSICLAAGLVFVVVVASRELDRRPRLAAGPVRRHCKSLSYL